MGKNLFTYAFMLLQGYLICPQTLLISPSSTVPLLQQQVQFDHQFCLLDYYLSQIYSWVSKSSLACIVYLKFFSCLGEKNCQVPILLRVARKLSGSYIDDPWPKLDLTYYKNTCHHPSLKTPGLPVTNREVAGSGRTYGIQPPSDLIQQGGQFRYGRRWSDLTPSQGRPNFATGPTLARCGRQLPPEHSMGGW